MLDVFFSVDVEIWCDGWDNLDEKFPDAFRRYVYGPTARGNFGLPYTLQVLREHGLKGVFFVEPLFSTRFGSQPLEEIIGLIREGGQEIQLHLHPEWVNESVEPLLENIERQAAASSLLHARRTGDSRRCRKAPDRAGGRRRMHGVPGRQFRLQSGYVGGAGGERHSFRQQLQRHDIRPRQRCGSRTGVGGCIRVRWDLRVPHDRL